MAGQRKCFVFHKLKIPETVVTLSPPLGDPRSSTLVPQVGHLGGIYNELDWDENACHRNTFF